MNGQMAGKFPLGQIVATPGALEALQESGETPWDFISRHVAGNWGDLDAEDKLLNEQALKDGSRLFSAYHTTLGKKLYVISEAVDDDGNRAATTLLLPVEY